jgi:hypothetical protein
MTTSGSVDYSITRNQIIKDALIQCNGVEEDEDPTPNQILTASRFLNSLVKAASAKFPLWGTVDYTIPLYDLKQSYTIGPSGNKNVNRPLKITQGRRIVQGSDTETPIFQESRQNYMELPLKSSQSPVNLFYYDAQLTQGVLYVWGVSNTSSVSLSDGSTDQWTDSPTTPGEYYYTGSDITAEPKYVFENGSEMTEGTLGSLTSGQYAWGNQDALAANTLYVFGSADPDTKASGYIKALTTTPDKIIVTAHRPLEDFDDADNTPDFPQEDYLWLVFALAELLCPQYDYNRLGYLTGKAAQLRAEFLTSDTENASFSVSPRNPYGY